MTDQQALRRQLRRVRVAIPPGERAAAEAAVIDGILRHPRFRHARRVALYYGSNGEIDPMPLAYHAPGLRKDCFLPVLHPFRRGRLWFYRWRPGERLLINRFGIPEPISRKRHLISANRLDLVIVPLLGFDDACHRLGMGGGYYDRTFAFVNRLRFAKRPFLLGVAHECQHVSTLPIQPWDVRLDAVITERNQYVARTHMHPSR